MSVTSHPLRAQALHGLSVYSWRLSSFPEEGSGLLRMLHWTEDTPQPLPQNCTVSPLPLAGHPWTCSGAAELGKSRNPHSIGMGSVAHCQLISKDNPSLPSGFPCSHRKRSSVPVCRAHHCLGTPEPSRGAVSLGTGRPAGRSVWAGTSPHLGRCPALSG